LPRLRARIVVALPVRRRAFVPEAEVVGGEPPFHGPPEHGGSAPAVRGTAARQVSWVVDSLEERSRHAEHHAAIPSLATLGARHEQPSEHQQEGGRNEQVQRECLARDDQCVGDLDRVRACLFDGDTEHLRERYKARRRAGAANRALPAASCVLGEPGTAAFGQPVRRIIERPHDRPPLGDGESEHRDFPLDGLRGLGGEGRRRPGPRARARARRGRGCRPPPSARRYAGTLHGGLELALPDIASYRPRACTSTNTGRNSCKQAATPHI